MENNVVTLPKTIRVWERGQLTIPKDIREEVNIGENSAVNIFRIGKSIIITPKMLLGPKLARQVEKAMKKEGITLNDLISDLKKERERYNRETYGI